ncbi:MAG: ABC transporter ATP-binding protein [Xanthomonadales bacterium]|nr:ABC transporter ATP-binding protein [Xanthomonadales bacterium]
MLANNLDIEGLSISFSNEGEELMALRQVSLSVPRHSIVGIVGESGCGKSTLISSIFRLPMENAIIKCGRIHVNGTDVLTLDEEEMNRLRGKEIAMIFQDPFTALNPVLTIGSQLIDIQYRQAISRKEKKQNVIAALQQVGIDRASDRFNQYPHQFSGGMLQRICIAMALLVKPTLLVADEPTTALDATTELQILALIREFHRSTGASVLLVSHHLSVIAELCDRVVVMYAGEIVEEGLSQDVFGAPLHPYTNLLMQCDPARIKEKARHLPSIPGTVSRVVKTSTECIFVHRCPQAVSRCSELVPETYSVEGRTVKCHLISNE